MANRSVILELIVQDKNSAKVTKRLQNEFGAVEKSANRSAAAMVKGNKQVTGSTRVMRNSISGANQTLFSFGDIVNDAQQFQFGFAQGSRAIGNNIAFMAEQFSGVQTQAGGFTNALKAMGGSLLGPGGIILGLNLAISAATLFGEELFGLEEQSKDTKEALDVFNTAFEKTIELQEQFGAFDDDEFGIGRITATIREAEEDALILQGRLSRVQEINEEIAAIESRAEARSGSLQTATALNTQEKERIENLRQQGRLLGEESELEEQIKTLNQEKLALSFDLVTISEELADSDTKQAREKKKKREEQQRLISFLERELEMAQKIAQFRAESQKARREEEERRKQAEEKRQEEREAFLSDDFGGLPSDPTPDPGLEAEEGSISELQDRMRAFQNMRKMLDPASQGFQELTKSIKETRDEIDKLEGGTKDYGEVASVALKEVVFGLTSIFDRHRQIDQAVEEGRITQKEAAEERKKANREAVRALTQRILFEAILSAVESIPFPANIVAAGVALAAANALMNQIPSFRHGVDDFEGGMAKVHQGEVITMLPPGANVLTNQNVEALNQMRQESRQGAANLMGMGGGGIDPDMIERAIIEGMRQSSVNLSMDPLDEKLGDFSQLKKRIGNG